MAHAKKKSATGTSAVGGRDTCNKLPCDRDDSLLLRYIKNLPTARESNPPLTFIQLEECGLQGDRKLAVNGNVSGK